MRETRRRISMTSSVFSGSGPSGASGGVRPSSRSSFDGAPCTGSTFSHHAFTSGALEKKRWPPMSMRLPCQATVREMPPKVSLSSKSVTR